MLKGSACGRRVNPMKRQLKHQLGRKIEEALLVEVNKLDGGLPMLEDHSIVAIYNVVAKRFPERMIPFGMVRKFFRTRHNYQASLTRPAS